MSKSNKVPKMRKGSYYYDDENEYINKSSRDNKKYKKKNRYKMNIEYEEDY